MTDAIERFDNLWVPEPNTGCHLWVGPITAREYGAFRYKGETIAHRSAWVMKYRCEIPSGLVACHKCDTPLCVNPDHLFLGTQKDNVMDCVAKGRAKKLLLPGEANKQAKLTEQQVREIRARPGTNSELAALYGISQAQVSKIRTRAKWKHIA